MGHGKIQLYIETHEYTGDNRGTRVNIGGTQGHQETRRIQGNRLFTETYGVEFKGTQENTERHMETWNIWYIVTYRNTWNIWGHMVMHEDMGGHRDTKETYDYT